MTVESSTSAAVRQSMQQYYARQLRERSEAVAKAYDLNQAQESRNPGAASDIGDYATRLKHQLDVTA